MRKSSQSRSSHKNAAKSATQSAAKPRSALDSPPPRPVLFNRQIILLGLGLFALGWLLFLINIQFPRGQNFDEFHYVPSAKQFLEMRENQNWEHPPLGKLLMAIGIGTWGDIPIGWRFMSTVFGAITLVGMSAWALVLFESQALAVWVGLITLLNQLLYVQARIGMLDTFMFAFLVWALVGFTATWRQHYSHRTQTQLLALTGVCLGLATACKWFAIMPWAACVGLVVFIRVLQHWKTSFGDETLDDWYSPELWRDLRWSDWILWLGVVPVVVYLATFTPYFIIQKPPVGFLDLFNMQARMYDGQLRVVGSHPYMSTWMDWPLMRRPIWYAFDKEGASGEFVRGVVLLGNPIVMWSGLVALLACLWGWFTNRGRDSFLILFFYGVFFGSWVLIPRKVSFYYYYYPAGMVLSLALAYVFHHGEHGKYFERFKWARWVFLAACLGMFIYFFPVLAGLRIPSDTFRKWMWFRSWI